MLRIPRARGSYFQRPVIYPQRLQLAPKLLKARVSAPPGVHVRPQLLADCHCAREPVLLARSGVAVVGELNHAPAQTPALIRAAVVKILSGHIAPYIRIEVVSAASRVHLVSKHVRRIDRREALTDRQLSVLGVCEVNYRVAR